MKLSNPFGAFLFVVLLAALLNSPSARAITVTANPSSATNAASDAQVAPAPAPEHPPGPHFSPGVPEILKMLEAKVDPDVIKAYIKNSTVPYNLSAAEIIELKNKGVPDEILAALVQRGGEVRAQAVAPGQSGPVTPVPYAMPNQYPYQYPQAYDYGTPDYAGYPYYGAYPYYPYSYWWYNYGYPWYGFSYFYSPFCHFDGHGFCHFHHSFHSGHSGNFNGHWANHGGWNHASQGANHASTSPFAPFNGRSVSGSRAMSPFGTFNPNRTGFASAPGGFRTSSGFAGSRPAAFGAARPASFGGARPAAFASHVGGGFRAGGGFAGRGGGGGHR